MRKQGAGWIVNLGSSTAIHPEGPPYDDYSTHGGAALYAAVKAAVHRLTINQAAELLADNISVNAVAPVGAILTPGVEALGVITEETKAYAEPKEMTGKIAFSYMFLDAIGWSTRSLDGKTIIQDRKAAS
jgi:NAD(P)-dependent dehydrogenase (short-subunit alcohol dehydrogenase family)